MINLSKRRRTRLVPTAKFTPREMEWIANGAGLDPDAVYGIAPGAYAIQAPTRDHPELLLLATKPKAELAKNERIS